MRSLKPKMQTRKCGDYFMKLNWRFILVLGFLGAFISIISKLFSAINNENTNTVISIITLIRTILIVLIVPIFSLHRLDKFRPKWVSFAHEGYHFKTWYFISTFIFLHVYNIWLFDILKQKLLFINSQIITNALIFMIPFAFINILSICTGRFTCEKNSDSQPI